MTLMTVNNHNEQDKDYRSQPRWSAGKKTDAVLRLRPGWCPSMGAVGACFDNAMIESFWSRMQVELLDRQRWHTPVELADAILEYLEVFHNRQRRHSSIVMLT